MSPMIAAASDVESRRDAAETCRDAFKRAAQTRQKHRAMSDEREKSTIFDDDLFLRDSMPTPYLTAFVPRLRDLRPLENMFAIRLLSPTHCRRPLSIVCHV